MQTQFDLLPHVPHSQDSETGQAFSFGPFRLVKAQMQLTENGVPVRLGSRALELLLVLVERSGEVLSRQELEARVWPQTVVEETSLRVQIAALRKALRDGSEGARYITNIPGRGYCFVAHVQKEGGGIKSVAAIAIAANRAYNNLPPRLSTVVGRDDITLALHELLDRRRLVSIVGPGGIGKTTVALAVAAEHVTSYEHGALFVDFAPLTDPELVPSALAFALGFETTGGLLLPQLCEFLKNRRMLMVLDNCEHVLEAAARLVESVMKAAPEVHILTTTREPLFADGEWVHRLSALVAPATAEKLTQEEALTFSAIRLFVERAEANADDFMLSQENLLLVRQLCLRLDGIPLAIELAAARVGSLGVEALAQRLDELFHLLNRGRRTAMPRHQTLEALLDWSFDLLTDSEQAVLRRLSVFRSSFSLESATGVAAFDGISAETVVECVMSLATKSLLNTDVPTPWGQYRLLYMTRAYAARKLPAHDESRVVQRRHAELFLDLAKVASRQWSPISAERWKTFGPLRDDFRAALDWALSPDGDDHIGVELTVAAWIPSCGLGLFNEYRARVEKALECVPRLSLPSAKLELALYIAWCFLSGQSVGMSGRRQVEVFAHALALAEQIGEVELHAETLYAICVGSLGQGNYRAVIDLANQVKKLVGSGPLEPLSVLLADRMLVLAHHNLGDHTNARALATRVLNFPAEQKHMWYIGQVPRVISMGIVEARILWLQGCSEQAVRASRIAVEHAIGEHPFALSQAIALAAIPIALWRGDWSQAREWIDALLDHAMRHSLGYWRSWAESYVRLHQRLTGTANDAIAENWAWTTNPSELDMLATLSPELLEAGTLARVEAGQVGWCGPEVLRVAGEKLLREQGTAAVSESVKLFERGLEMARLQGALAWELRLVTSLVALRSDESLPYGPELLRHTLDRFTEGVQTADLARARDLLRTFDAQPSLLDVGVRT